MEILFIQLSDYIYTSQFKKIDLYEVMTGFVVNGHIF